ncbi:FAD/NAD(P)-binding protein [Winogradskyella epiphytica]|nr:FAD/NAD(P)-binding protein [Winogradskyella epiphytica]
MKQLAIIGMGPRGLYALENLLMHLGQLQLQVGIRVFEPSDQPGAGQVWHSKQPDSNWTNTSERGLGRVTSRSQITYGNCTIEEFPSYSTWYRIEQHDKAIDTFPPRHKLGKYLHERYKSMEKVLINLDSFNFINAEVQNINFDNNSFYISTNDSTWTSDDVLLTIGHQPTQLSDDILRWQNHSIKDHQLFFIEDTYPISQLKDIRNNTDINIGIRGFGLTMIDVMRYLSINKFGDFKVINSSTLKTVYDKSEEQNLKLIPFSSYGLPLVPKPLNKAIDSWFAPTIGELNKFKTEIEAISKTSCTTHSIRFLTEPFAEITARIFIDLKEKAIPHSHTKSEIKVIILNLLDDINYTHHLLQDESIPTYPLIERYIAMALGQAPLTLDYCIGQVWRHCQPTLYQAFSHANVDTKIIEQVLSLNDRSKRYSYGPPIESMQQILALVDVGILTFDYIKDPDITLVTDGWRMKNDKGDSTICAMMINSVLDEPKLLNTTSPIFKQLLHDELIRPIHPEFGVHTSKNGYIKLLPNQPQIPLAILGRMAKGSVIGVDSISECFGQRIEDWAQYYISSLQS